MEFLKDRVGKIVQAAVQKSFPGESITVKVEYPGQDAHGDYATSVAFELGKKMKRAPRDVAQELGRTLSLDAEFSKVTCAGNGFINFHLSEKFLTEFLGHVLQEGEHFGESDYLKGKTVITDISHPNVAKPMGAHHLLSTIIGNAINRILAAAGYRVIRDNYLGDWGTQFGKLIWAIKTWGDEKEIRKNPIPELLKLYVRFHEEAEKNPALEEEGRKEFKKLEAGDAENKKWWKWIVSLSIEEFNKLWQRLDVTFDYIHGESFYEDKMQEIIEMGIKKGIFVEGEGGALIAHLKDPKKPPCIIRKSDGATLYATRDLARTKYWEDTWHPDLMVMVVDSAQSLHFQQFFEVAEMIGITKAPNVHVSFGRMRFPEKRMSTRKGNIILMEELLDEALERAHEMVKEKNPELSEDEKKEVARKVGIGSVKYAVLAQNRLTDVTFTWEKMLSLEGNSAPYLQYVYARARSILRKDKGMRKEDQGHATAYLLQEPQEVAVARLLPKFPEVVVQAAEEFKPNLIANYLYELATRFNSFYAALPVLKAEPEVAATRQKLTEAVAVTMKNGLKLLGIEAPEEM